MTESRPVQKSLPHELVDRFASEVAPPGLRAVGLGLEPRPAPIGGRMVRVMIQYAEGVLDR